MSNSDPRIQRCIQLFKQNHINQNITNINVRTLRLRFIVTALVNDTPVRQSIPFEHTNLPTNQSTQDTSESSSNDDSSYNSDDIPYAKCIACENVGPIGNLCTDSDCEDSNAIYADPV